MGQPKIDTTSPVTATATFTPAIIRPGDTAVYRVTFNAMMDSIRWPEDVIAPEQLQMQPGGRGQIIAWTGTNQQPRTTFNTRAKATSEGVFTVPRYMVYVYGQPVTVPAAQVVVTSDPAVAVSPTPEIRLEFSTTNPFVGQPINARVILEGDANGVVRTLAQIKLLGEGFMTDQTQARQRVAPLAPGSNSVAAFIYEIALTPITPGPVAITAQGFTAGLQLAGPITLQGRATILGGQPAYELMDSAPATLNVRSIPQEGELPGYTGAIGRFRIDSPTLATNVMHVGDPVTYSVRIMGEGNLARLVPPPPPKTSGWKVFAGEPDPGPPQLVSARGFIIFNYTLIPTTERINHTPAIPFSFFDLETGQYVPLNLPSQPVTVKPSAVPVSAIDLAEAEAPTSGREPEPRLSGLSTQPGQTMASLQPWQLQSWFPVVQLAPAFLFAGLWWWDRRRRYLEAHPELVLRRRARRALHHEWAALRKAASLGDTSRFAACAVNAMRVACAPHYRAEPRALVSSDVLPLLDETDGSNGAEVVSQIFASANADRFNTQPSDAKDLLALRGDMDRVLAQLEAKL